MNDDSAEENHIPADNIRETAPGDESPVLPGCREMVFHDQRGVVSPGYFILPGVL